MSLRTPCPGSRRKVPMFEPYIQNQNQVVNHQRALIGESCHHREVWVRRDLKAHPVSSPCHGQGCLPLHRAVQGPLQPGLNPFIRNSSCSLHHHHPQPQSYDIREVTAGCFGAGMELRIADKIVGSSGREARPETFLCSRNTIMTGG